MMLRIYLSNEAFDRYKDIFIGLRSYNEDIYILYIIAIWCDNLSLEYHVIYFHTVSSNIAITWRRLNNCDPKQSHDPCLSWWRHQMQDIFRVTDLLWEESTGYRWIPLTKASDAELWYYLWSAPEQTVVQTIETLVIWDVIAPIMMSL